MYSVKSRLVTQPFLWHIKFKQAVTQPSSWLQFISTTQQNADSAKAMDQNTFEKFATAAERPRYKKKTHKKHMLNIYSQRSQAQDLLRPRDQVISSSALQPTQNLMEDNPLEKWHRFKDAEYEKILRQSDNFLRDDSEDEYHFFRKGNLKGVSVDSNNSNENLDKKLHINSPLQSEAKESTVEIQSYDTFGTSQLSKNEHEDMTDDEGDRREEKFEETRTAKKHKPQYYGQQIKMLCKENKVSHP